MFAMSVVWTGWSMMCLLSQWHVTGWRMVCLLGQWHVRGLRVVCLLNQWHVCDRTEDGMFAGSVTCLINLGKPEKNPIQRVYMVLILFVKTIQSILFGFQHFFCVCLVNTVYLSHVNCNI